MEIIPAVVVTILFVIASTYAILTLGLTDPSWYLSERIFSRLAEPKSIQVSVASFDRNLFSYIKANDVSLSLPGSIDFHAEEVTSKDGLWDIFRKSRTPNSLVNLNLEHPTGTINLDGFSSGENGTKGKMPSFSCQLNLNGADLSLTYASSSCSVQGANVRLLFHEGFSFGSASGYLPLLDFISGDKNSVVAKGSNVYIDEVGNASIIVSKIGGKLQGIPFGLSDIAANMKTNGDTYQIEASGNELAVEAVPVRIGIPLVSTVFYMKKDSFAEGSVSLRECTGTGNGYSFRVPASTLALRKEDGSLLGKFATSDAGNPTTLKFGETSVMVESPVIQGILYPDKTFSLKGTVNDMSYRTPTDKIELAAFSLVGRGESTKDIRAEAKAVVAYHSLTKKVDVTSYMSGTFAIKDGITSMAHLNNVKTNLFDMIMDGELTYHQDTEGKGTLQAEITSGGNMSLSALLEHVETGHPLLDIEAHANALSVNTFAKIISSYLPAATPYVDKDSTFSGNLSLFTDIQKSGKVQFDFSLNGMKFGNYRFAAGLTGKASLSNGDLEVQYLTLGVQNYRMLFNGDMEIGKWLPSGKMVISNNLTGNELLTIQFLHTDALFYDYLATTSRFPSFRLKGILQQDEKAFTSEAELDAGGVTYPISFRYSLLDQLLDARSNDMISLFGYIKNPLVLTLSMKELNFPETERLKDSMVSADTIFRYTTKNDWAFDAKNIHISGIQLNHRSYTFGGNLEVNPDLLDIRDITVSDGKETYQGFATYGGTALQENATKRFSLPFSFSSHFSDGGKQLFDLYVEHVGEKFEVMADVQSLDLSHFLPENKELTGSLSLVGDTDLKQQHNMSGKILLENKDLKASSDIILQKAVLSLAHGLLSYKGQEIKDFNLSLNLPAGTLDGSFRFNSDYHINVVEPEGSSADIQFHAGFQSIASIADVFNLKDQLEKGQVVGKIDMKNGVLFGRKLTLFDDSVLNLGYAGSRLSWDGAYANGWYDIKSHEIEAFMDKKPTGLGFNLSGNLNSDNLSCSLKNLSFDLTWLNKVMADPTAVFESGIGEGDLYVTGSLSSPLIYGQAICDSLAMTVFYLPEDKLYAKNVLLWADGSSVSTALINAYATNIHTGKTVKGTTQFSFTLSGMMIDTLICDVTFPQDKVFFYLPITDSDMDIRAYVSGHLHFMNKGKIGSFSNGYALLENGSITIGIKDCPDWYYSSNSTSSDFILRMGKNNRFFYPNTPNPMFSATLQEGEEVHIIYDHIKKQFQMSGNLAIRNGEIFYFQKNFFINEGSISFLNSVETIQPILNLRARMRNYDENGNPVDIYLVLKNSTLTNLSPSFESSPPMGLEEIMSMLGQSILPSEAYGNMSLYRVASMATMATDVAQRMGWIKSGSVTNLSDTIRTSLGLDMFTLHSNVLQNVIIDALPGSNAITVSPVARYLNNTSVFMGKYLGNNMFLQALFHLTALDKNSSRTRSPFLVNDLALNLEMSVEWATPLCTYSLFTQPNELSLIQILDTIGFSVTKRIVLR